MQRRVFPFANIPMLGWSKRAFCDAATSCTSVATLGEVLSGTTHFDPP